MPRGGEPRTVRFGLSVPNRGVVIGAGSPKELVAMCVLLLFAGREISDCEQPGVFSLIQLNGHAVRDGCLQDCLRCGVRRRSTSRASRIVRFTMMVRD